MGVYTNGLDSLLSLDCCEINWYDSDKFEGRYR